MRPRRATSKTSMYPSAPTDNSPRRRFVREEIEHGRYWRTSFSDMNHNWPWCSYERRGHVSLGDMRLIDREGYVAIEVVRRFLRADIVYWKRPDFIPCPSDPLGQRTHVWARPDFARASEAA